jgi:hypothetical protein
VEPAISELFDDLLGRIGGPVRADQELKSIRGVIDLQAIVHLLTDAARFVIGGNDQTYRRVVVFTGCCWELPVALQQVNISPYLARSVEEKQDHRVEEIRVQQQYSGTPKEQLGHAGFD